MAELTGEVISTAREAFERGEKRYFSGKPCKYGHVDQRMVANGSCVECQRIRCAKDPGRAYRKTKEWRLANPTARTEEARRWRARHPEKAAEIKARYRAKDPDRIREMGREAARRMRAADPEAQKRRHAAFRARREVALTAEAGRPRPSVCELCHEEGPTVWDHCHVAGHFRGWICDRCNKTLGMVRDSPALLRAMAEYLEGKNGRADGPAEGQASSFGVRTAGGT